MIRNAHHTENRKRTVIIQDTDGNTALKYHMVGTVADCLDDAEFHAKEWNKDTQTWRADTVWVSGWVRGILQ